MKNERRSPRVFLDTCVINFIADHYESIFTGHPPPKDPRDAKDAAGIQHILGLRQGPSCELAVSSYTYAEVLKTKDDERRRHLQDWLRPIWDCWICRLEEDNDLPSLAIVERFKIQLLVLMDLHETLPDLPDRILLVDALLYRCDYFCTRDRKSVLDLSHRADGLLRVLEQSYVVATRRIFAPRIMSPGDLWEDLIAEGYY